MTKQQPTEVAIREKAENAVKSVIKEMLNKEKQLWMEVYGLGCL